jgi:hypothetical protein
MRLKCHPCYEELAGLLLRCVDARIGWRPSDSALGLDFVRIEDFSVAEYMSIQHQLVRIIDNFLAEWMVTPSVPSCDIASRFLVQTNHFDLALADEGEIPEGIRADYLAAWLAAYLHPQG